MRNLLTLCSFVVLLSGCTTRYYLVRHAERQDASANSPLSVAGLARANVLRDTLLSKGIDTIFASTFQRTQQTAQPLATALHLPVTIYSPDTTAALIDQLSRLNGRNVLVVGHSNTIPEIVRGLCGQTVTIADDDFDNLFIVTVKKGWGNNTKTLEQTTYGPASPAGQ